MLLLDYNLERILDFIQKHLKYPDRELLREYVKKHEKYGTVDYAIDSRGNLVGFVRHNLSADGTVSDVLDFVVDENWRNKGVGKDFVLRALKRFPKIEYLTFHRGIRGDQREHKISVKGILKRNIF